MSDTTVIPRIIKINGRIDFSYVPCFEEDIKLFKNVASHSRNTPISFKVKQRRNPTSNRQFWGIIHFLIENSEKLNNELGEKSNNPDFVYRWIKIQIGFVDTFQKGNEIYMFPRSASFKDIPDEQQYIKEFKNPALDFIARYMGYNSAEDLKFASNEWAKNKLINKD